MRAITAIAVTVLLALGLGACGSKDAATTTASKQDYCNAVRRLAGKHRPAPQRFASLVQDAGNVATGTIAGDWRDIANAYLTNVGPVRAQVKAVRRQIRSQCHVGTTL